MGSETEIQTTLKEIVARIVCQYRPQTIILCGSLAYGTPDEDSGIDLLIIKDTSQRFIDRWVAVRTILSGPHRTIPVETLVLTPEELTGKLSRGDQFIEEILAKGQVLYAS